MKKKVEIKRKRILIYYALAIVLPCLILGILALRGIKNDQALVERDQRRNLLETSQQIFHETDAFLLSIENGFAEIIDSASIPRTTIFTDSSLNRFNARNQAVSGIFFLSGSGVPLLLNNGLIYVPDDFLPSSDEVATGTFQSVMEKGWQIEFRENNYPKALEYYQHVFQNVQGNQSGGEILNSIARIQKKMKLDDKAMETYELIWNDYPQVLIQNKLPLGAVALLEKSLLSLAQKDTVSASKTVHLLLSQLYNPRWELCHSTYASLLSKTDEIISMCENSHNEETVQLLMKVHTARDSLSLSEKQTGYLLALPGNSEIITVNTKKGSENNNHRSKIMINGQSYLVSLVPGSNQGQWGLIMDHEYILNNIVDHLILKNSDRSNFYWEIKDVNGELLSKSEYISDNTPPVNTSFPSNLPSWSLTLYPEDPGLFVSLFRPGQSLFLYIFIAIVIILAFGLFFTIQTVNNELHLSKMKSYFISTVSHEFKSPLTSIRQMAEMLVHDRVPSPERQRKYYTGILKQSERLSHLINNILDFSKMEEGKRSFLFEKADIVPFVRDIVETFLQHTADQGFLIDLVIPEPLPDVVFDGEAMEQVVHNLLDNACKYSGDSRKIEVHLLSKGNKIVISVRDFGVGIKKEDLDKIFSRFYRAGEELTQTIKGSGIGLTIVKQIVEAHHGEIAVESSPGKGSTFTVRLPLTGI
jgi:signal transduction histidine kinase/tetratricopeptide (TPR) repeat protein